MTFSCLVPNSSSPFEYNLSDAACHGYHHSANPIPAGPLLLLAFRLIGSTHKADVFLCISFTLTRDSFISEGKVELFPA